MKENYWKGLRTPECKSMLNLFWRMGEEIRSDLNPLKRGLGFNVLNSLCEFYSISADIGDWFCVFFNIYMCDFVGDYE